MAAAKFIIVGLGNPGDEYRETRHNVGRRVLEELVAGAKDGSEFSEWAIDKKIQALKSTGEIDGKKVLLVMPETFMNNSGRSVSALVNGVKQAKNLIVVYDDIDLPLGTIKINFGRSSGGHRGLESIIRAIKTKDFARIRIGVSPVTAAGRIKKPASEVVTDFIVGRFKPAEVMELKKIIKKAQAALVVAVTDGWEKAANGFN